MIPTQKEYEDREAMEFIRQRNAPNELSRMERKDAAAEFAKDMASDPALVAARVSWLLNGSYGYGSYQAARKVAANTHMTREAWMVQVIGAIEWQCREVDTRKAFNAMTKAQQKALTVAVLAEISEHLTEQQAEQNSAPIFEIDHEGEIVSERQS